MEIKEIIKNNDLFYLVLFGWILGLFVNFISFFYVNLAKIIPYILVYQLIIIPIWMNSSSKNIIESKKLKYPSKENYIKKGGLLSGTPVWLKDLTMGTLFFAILSFVFIMVYNGGSADYKNGKYILQSHGNFIKFLTKQEYIRNKLYESKMLFSHWTAFYGFIVALLYKIIRK